MASDEIGVTTSSSSVCFSRSRLIAPAVDAGARKATWSVSSISSAAKMPCPIDAVADAVAATEAGRVRPLEDQLDHQREAAEEQR